MKINPVVFFVAGGIIVMFVLLGAIFPAAMEETFTRVQDFIVTRLGWLYITAVGFFLVFVIWLLLSPYAKVKLGHDDEEPEYSTGSWFAMLFSAGMGIGLLFYSVAEPVMHFTNPPRAAAGTLEAARDAMQITFFHWGLHAWAVYVIVGLALAYFSYRHNLPLTIRSTLYPLVGNRIHGWIGNLVTIIAIFGTMFGVATSLGLGVMQVNAGMEHLGLFEVSTRNQIILIIVITLMATASVVSGLDVGIKRLSELNMGLGLLLIVFVFFAGPTVFLINSFVQTTGQYLQDLVGMTFRTDAFIGPEWQKSWTMFYWGWWISWSPFVGMFIARVSRGRTIRQFVLGTLFMPALLAFVWMVIFGNSAIRLELLIPEALRPGPVARAVEENLPTGLFVLLEQMPLSTIMVVIATVVIATYFITSSDSASLVIDILSADGDLDPPLGQRIFWALTEGAVAAVLLLTGGLVALQTVAITTALPFCIIMLFMCLSLVRGLKAERVRRIAAPREGVSGRYEEVLPLTTTAVQPERQKYLAEQKHQELLPREWKESLHLILSRKPQKEHADPHLLEARERLARFIKEEVAPAFEDLKSELARHDRECVVTAKPFNASLLIMHGNQEEFSYTIRSRAYRRMTAAFPELVRKEHRLICRAEVVLQSGSVREYDIQYWKKESIIRNVLYEYGKWMGW